MILHKIPTKEGDEINITEFYNKYFIGIYGVKEHIKNYKKNNYNNEQKRNIANNPLLTSPLKDVLPRVVNKNVKKVVKDGNANLMQSYADSPLLKI